MITEEETEKMKADLKQLYSLLLLRPSISTNAIENALQYIEQLETEKQNVIDKLEEKDKIIRNLKKDLFSGERFYRV